MHFIEYGFIEEINGGYKFHDLLFELINQYWLGFLGEKKYQKLHKDIHAKYLNSEIPEKLALVYMIEPLYHILKVSEEEAQPYFEKIIKHELDRKSKILSSIILNEIEFSALPNNNIKGWYLLRLGGYFREFDEYDKALNIFNESLQYSIGDEKLTAFIKNNIGWVYLFHNPSKNVDNAITLFIESNILCEKNNLKVITGMNLNNLGIAFERKKKHEEAIKYYTDSLEITLNKESYNPIVSAKTFRNIALIYEEKSDSSNAIKFYEKAIEKYVESNDVQSIGESLLFISKIFFRRNEIKNAINVCLSSIKYLELKKYGHYLSESHLLLSEILLKINELKTLPTSHIILLHLASSLTGDIINIL